MKQMLRFGIIILGSLSLGISSSHEENSYPGMLHVFTDQDTAKTLVLSDDEIESDSLIYTEGNDSLLAAASTLGIKINHDANVIGNDEALAPFFQKMINAAGRNEEVISIYHIGDSHVAGKSYPQSVAGHLHELYGPGKTTIITPMIKMKVHRGQGKKPGRHSIKSGKRSAAKGKTSVAKQKKHRSSAFLFIEKSSDLAALDHMPLYGNLLLHDARISDAVEADFILPANDSNSLTKLTINYAAYGVPGKSFKYFAENQNVVSHLKTFLPDLVIISLGVNDIFGKRVDEDYILSNLSRLLSVVRKERPSAAIVLGLSTDAWVKKKKSNPFLPILKRLMITFAEKNTCAYWDPVPVFGGYGCMNRWYKQKLCGKDRIHLTIAGYTLLGEMLAEALDKSFTAYAEKNSGADSSKVKGLR